MARASELLPERDRPVEVSCRVEQPGGTEASFLVAAEDLLQGLEEISHAGGEDHPNKLELQAQRALLRHCIQHHAAFRLHDDHWSRTSIVLRDLFEQGKALMQIDNKAYLFSDVTKEKWKEVTAPMMGVGGFLYRNGAGAVVYKWQTWIS